MKKRIMCALLTLVMLVSLVPMGASAAGLAISESAITVLKQLETYDSTCNYVSGTEHRVGYGTICDQPHATPEVVHTTTEAKADKALRAKLKDLDAAVNTFSSKTGKTLTQGQHDALVMFSYDVGTSWMNGTGVMRSAVVNGLTGNDFINTMCGFYASTADDDRRRVEAGMYLDGVYSSTHPYNYAWVDFDPNGGSMVENERFYYDYDESVTITRVPTRPGYTFMGWYDAETNGAWITTLDDDNCRQTLYAYWQNNANPAYTDVEYYTNISKFTSRQPLALPDEDAEEKGDKIERGATVKISEEFIDADGARWCRISASGWVKMGASDSSSGIDIDVVVTVTNDYVRSRKESSIYSAQNGTYYKGDQLRIINTDSGDGFLWGQVANDEYEAIGWVALMYTDWETAKNGSSNSDAIVVATAVINCNGYLIVRREADSNSAIVGSLANGDTVDIHEIKVVNGHQWGRTSGGWILLTYAKVTMKKDLDYSNNADVLAYTFAATVRQNANVRADASDSADVVGTLKKDDRIAVTMLKLSNNVVWGYNGTGWVKRDDFHIDTANYIVVADSVTVRDAAASSGTMTEKIVKGVEVEITDLMVGDATIWGYTAKYNGWINLASKYVKRTNAPTIEKDDSDSATGLMATVINTDSVRVREDDTTSSKQIGSLKRGTTVIVWDVNGDEDWYKVDSNQDGDYDYDGDGWVYAQYLDIYEAGSGDDEEGSDGTGTSTSVETGLGIVANTYTGVNVRTGAGTGNGLVGKILTGTTVEILEVKQVGAAKWGRVSQGWICMDYVTMIKNYPIAGDSTNTNNNTQSNAGTNAGGSTSTTAGNITVVSTPAVYVGQTLNDVAVVKTADADAQTVRTLSAGAKVTVQELRKVTNILTTEVSDMVDGEIVTEEVPLTDDDGNKITVTEYWARVDEGWIQDPDVNVALNALDEVTYTVTSNSSVGLYTGVNGSKDGSLDKGEQIEITELEISGNVVWGKAENLSSGRWVRLHELAEGAIDTKVPETTAPQAPSDDLVLGSTGNTNNTGFVNNAGGYRYTGKIIRTNTVNVRATPSTTAALTTTMKNGAALVVYETTVNENMVWGRCDAGWVYLYYVDLTPCNTAIDAKVVYNENTIAYTDANCSGVAGTYSRMSVVDIYEQVGDMCRTELGWVHKDNLG